MHHWETGKDEAADEFKSGDLPYCVDIMSFGGKELCSVEISPHTSKRVGLGIHDQTAGYSLVFSVHRCKIGC